MQIAPRELKLPALPNQVLAGSATASPCGGPPFFRTLVAADIPTTFALLASPTFTGIVTLPAAITLADNTVITAGTSIGVKIGSGSTNKLGFYGTTPVVQPSGNVATALTNLGLVSAATEAVTSVFTRSGAVVATSGDYTVAQVTGAAPLASPTFTTAVTLPATITLADAAVITGGTSTGTKIGAATTNKLGFFGQAPVAQMSGSLVTALGTASGMGLISGPTIAAADVTGLVGTYALLSGPTFTGTPTLPTGTIATTQTAGNSTTAVATTAFVATSFAPLAGPTFTGTTTIPILNVASHYGAINAATDASTVTFNLSLFDKHSLLTTSGVGTNRILALSNATVGQVFTVILIQDATGSRTVTWFTTIKWAGGVTPVLTTTANKADVYTFLCYGSGTYYGMQAGLNF